MQQLGVEQLIIGSSRSARLPPSVLANAGSNAYNASLPGISLWEMRRMTEHAHSIQPLSRVIAGLDYYMFRPGYRNAMFRDDRLLRSDPSLGERFRHGHQVLLDRWSSLVSVDALLDAHATVSQAQRSQRRFYPDGTWEAKVPAHRVGTPVYRMLASQKYREFRNASENPDLTEFEALLDFAYAQEIELVLLVSPLHSIPLNAIELAGQWPAYLSWQRRLVEAIDRHPLQASLYGLENNVRLLTDPVGAQQPLFKDGVHYTALVGNSILACIDHQPVGCVAGLQPQLLDDTRIDAYLADLTRTMRSYAGSHPQEYAALKRWLLQLPE